MFNNLHRIATIMTLSLLSYLAVAQDLKINEVVSDNRTGLTDYKDDYQDWIEIINDGSTHLNLSGYTLSDDPENPEKWRFPSTLVRAHGYQIVFASEDDSEDNELHTNFKIADGETISLYNKDGELVDQIEVPKLKKDISYGRLNMLDNTLGYFEEPTPGKKNTTQNYLGYLPAPELSHESGFYSECVNLTATHEAAGVTIRYTLDGSMPTDMSASMNTGLNLLDASTNNDYFSLIKTNPGADFYDDGFTESRANSRGWLPPYTITKKTNVLQARAFKEGYIPSKSINETYFVFPDSSDTYSLPVISLTTDEDNFFDDEIGIYVYGTTGDEGNYKLGGDEWEREVHLQYFTNEGELGFEQRLGARIHGGGGRHSTLKNIRVYAREEYGKDKIKYDFFNDKDNDEFERLLIRGPGHRPDCTPRDNLADLLLENQDMDIQHLHPSILFINGEYWGIHTIKERFDTRYLAAKYGKDKDDYVMMKNKRSLDSGEEADKEHYQALLDFVDTCDMTIESNYEYTNTQMDIENYINYLAFEIYMGNSDWVVNNIRYWRYKGEDSCRVEDNALDGRWRWFMFDFDLVFGSSCASISYSTNMMDNAFDPELEGYTMLARGLKTSDTFCRDFINRMCDLKNSTFTVDNFQRCVTQIDNTKTPEMLEHVQRWRYPSAAETIAERADEVPSLKPWEETIKDLYNYPIKRGDKIIKQLTEEFDLDKTYKLTVDVNDMSMGTIKVNTIEITEELEGVTAKVYPWSGDYFTAIPVDVVAIPKRGYRFAFWDKTDDTDASLYLDLDKNTHLTAVFELDPEYADNDILFINEIMASNNKMLADEYDAHADWVEIYNPNDKAIDLSGYYVSDNADNLFKYQIPTCPETNIIAPKGYKLIWCDDKDDRGSLHTTLKLDASGEQFILTRADSSVVDSISFGEMEKDESFGRLNDGEDNWEFFYPTYGPTPNSANKEYVPSAIDDEEENNINLYPNPVKQGQIVHLSEKTSFLLYNAMGQCVKSEKDTKYIATRNLASGVYFLHCENGNHSKLIIQ